MKSKNVDEIRKELAKTRHAQFSLQWAYGAAYVLDTYYTPLLSRNEELEKCIRELVEAIRITKGRIICGHIQIVEETPESLAKWVESNPTLQSLDTALTNAKKLLNQRPAILA